MCCASVGNQVVIVEVLVGVSTVIKSETLFLVNCFFYLA